jgi:hypothetical protein
VDDDKMIAMSMVIDKVLLSLADQHSVSALSLSAVVMARAMLLCDAVGSGEDLRQLCTEIAKTPVKEPEVSLH